MEIIKTVVDLEGLLQGYRHSNKTIGLVPTMGALHDGHASLVRRCVAENDICVVSLFVNPTQFNNKEDLQLYPRTPEKDFQLLETIGADVVFSPSEEEIYPEADTRTFDFGNLDKVMEGRFRPGHFNGVAQVVSKLFAFVMPCRAYFGEKDFQQLVIVREMVKQLKIDVEIVGVPIVREASGLAMSSRNQRLSADQQGIASEIYRILNDSTLMTEQQSPLQLISHVTGEINNVPGLSVEYFEIVDGNSLQPVSSWQESAYIVGCTAVFCGDVRLIDNIRYR